MAGRLKIMIADDEPRVCVVIQNCIHWDELNMELIGIAHDGKELLEKIHEQNPDIVITDISMPEVNGLELIEQIRKENVKCKFIIISGYRQFEYAHKALKNNVDDYLLKPIDEQELNESLQRIKVSLIGEEKYGRESVEHLIADHKKSKEKVGRLFLYQMIKRLHAQESTGQIMEPLDPEKIEEQYGIWFGNGVYQAAVVKFDTTSKDGLADSLSSIQKKLVSIFEKVFENECEEILVDEESGSILFGIYYRQEKGYLFDEKFRKFYEYGKNIVDLFMGFSLTVGVSSRHDSLQEFPTAFREAKDAICYRITEGINQVLFYDKLQIPEKHYDGTAIEEILKKAEADFEILNAEVFRHHMCGWFFVDSKECNVPELVQLGERITNLFFEKQKKMGVEIQNADYTFQVILQKIWNAISLRDLKHAVTGPLSALMDELEEERKSQKKKPVRDAVRFISHHYQEALSLENVAAEVNLNPVYFSNIFKKETGENFVDYLHNLRISIAKDRLRREDTPVANIALEVGYSDAKYFSKIFKKYVGIKPTDYRKIYG